jgi:polar amino acid transport system substrate-binding protein
MLECKKGELGKACSWCQNFSKSDCVLLQVPHVKKLIENLELEKAEIEKASQYKSEFLANISHEIKTPMNAILGMSYLLEKTNLNGEQKNYIEKITTSANTLLGILNDILDMSKIESGKMQLNQGPVDMRRLLDEVISIVRFALEEKNLRLFVHMSNKIPRIIYSDEIRLKQIFLNLLNNAIKFTDRGEILVIGELGADNQIFFSIEDSGIGINEADKSKLFKPFVQADSSVRKRFQGSGLGLSICKNLINLLGGELRFESHVNKGSQFQFNIPVIEPKIKKQRSVNQGLKCYFIEDNLRIYEGLKLWASDSHLEIKVCKSLTDFAMQLDEDSAFLFLTRSYLMKASDNYLLIDLKRNLKLENIKTCILTQFLEKYPLASDFADIIDFHFTIPLQTWLLERLAEKLEEGREIEFRELPSQRLKTELQKLENIRILVVEDNIVNQMVTHEILTKMGAQVFVAEGGDEAIHMVSFGDKKFDIILMDIQMPNMDGYEAARRLKEFEWIKNTPIIALTAHSAGEIGDHFLNAGMVDFIPKPVEPEHMIRVIQKHSQNQFEEFYENFIPRNNFDFLESIEWDLAQQNVGNNESLLVTVISRFRVDYGQVPNFMRKSFFSGDLVQFEHNINALKAKSCYLGASRLRAFLEFLELIFKEECNSNEEKNLHRTEFYKGIADVDNEINLVCEEIEKYLKIRRNPINFELS